MSTRTKSKKVATAVPIRRQRTLSVMEWDHKMTPQEIGVLASFQNDPRYTALLDVMERGCIAQETALINADPADSEKVLAHHVLSKAMWQTFVWIQQRVEDARAALTELEAEKKRQAERDARSPEEKEIDEIVGVTR